MARQRRLPFQAPDAWIPGLLPDPRRAEDRDPGRHQEGLPQARPRVTTRTRSPATRPPSGGSRTINEANEVLSDPDKRAKYDRFGATGRPTNGPPGRRPAAGARAAPAARPAIRSGPAARSPASPASARPAGRAATSATSSGPAAAAPAAFSDFFQHDVRRRVAAAGEPEAGRRGRRDRRPPVGHGDGGAAGRRPGGPERPRRRRLAPVEATAEITPRGGLPRHQPHRRASTAGGSR